MDCELLIEAVRKREILCVSTSRCYKNSETKNAAWEEVASEVGVSGLLVLKLIIGTYFQISGLSSTSIWLGDG